MTCPHKHLTAECSKLTCKNLHCSTVSYMSEETTLGFGSLSPDMRIEKISCALKPLNGALPKVNTSHMVTPEIQNKLDGSSHTNCNNLNIPPDETDWLMLYYTCTLFIVHVQYTTHMQKGADCVSDLSM